MIFKNIILLYKVLITKHAYPLLSFYNAIVQILIFGIIKFTKMPYFHGLIFLIPFKEYLDKLRSSNNDSSFFLL